MSSVRSETVETVNAFGLTGFPFVADTVPEFALYLFALILAGAVLGFLLVMWIECMWVVLGGREVGRKGMR